VIQLQAITGNVCICNNVHYDFNNVLWRVAARMFMCTVNLSHRVVVPCTQSIVIRNIYMYIDINNK